VTSTRWVLPLLLLLVGCTGERDSQDSQPETGGETGAETGAETGGETGAETGGETGGDSAAPAGDEVIFEVQDDGRWEGAALTLLAFGVEKTGMQVGAALLTYELQSASSELAVPVPEDGFIGEISESWLGIQQGAWVLPFLFADDDADLVHSDTEAFVGLSMTSLLYVQAPLIPEADKAGLVEGWNAVVLDFTGEQPLTVTPLDLVPLSAELWPVESIEAGGTYDGSEAAEELRLALAPAMSLKGAPSGEALLDLPFTLVDDRWSLSVEGVPPEDHFSTDGETADAVEIPFTFLDDGDDQLSSGDTLTAFACAGDAAVALVYGAPSMSAEQALNAVISAAPRPGWKGMAGFPDELEDLDDGALDELVLSAACMPPPPSAAVPAGEGRSGP